MVSTPRRGSLVDSLAENLQRSTVERSRTASEQPYIKPERIAEKRPGHVSTCPSGLPHHFLIETPNGPAVEGVCKRCGETRVYPTVTTDLGFDVQLDGTRFGGRG